MGIAFAAICLRYRELRAGAGQKGLGLRTERAFETKASQLASEEAMQMKSWKSAFALENPLDPWYLGCLSLDFYETWYPGVCAFHQFTEGEGARRLKILHYRRCFSPFQSALNAHNGSRCHDSERALKRGKTTPIM